MATYTKRPDGAAECHGLRAVLTTGGLERVASLWTLTSRGLVKIYEAVRSCFGSGRWTGRKPWIGKERWRGAPRY